MQSYQQEDIERQATLSESAEATQEVEAEPTFLVGQHTVEELLAIAEEEASRKWRRVIPRGVLAMIGGLFCIMALQALIHINLGPGFSGVWPQFVIGAALTGWTSKRQREALKQLSQIEDLRAIGPLLDTFHMKSSHTAEFAMKPLIRLLPRLQASDAHLLNQNRRAALLTRLKTTANAEFAISILQTYEQIGTEAELVTVERLADGKGLAKKKQDVQQAAQACLSYLRIRVEAQRAQQTLLRASSPAGTPADVLLRPASGVVETPPDKLLRPTNTETA